MDLMHIYQIDTLWPRHASYENITKGNGELLTDLVRQCVR